MLISWRSYYYAPFIRRFDGTEWVDDALKLRKFHGFANHVTPSMFRGSMDDYVLESNTETIYGPTRTIVMTGRSCPVGYTDNRHVIMTRTGYDYYRNILVTFYDQHIDEGRPLSICELTINTGKPLFHAVSEIYDDTLFVLTNSKITAANGRRTLTTPNLTVQLAPPCDYVDMTRFVNNRNTVWSVNSNTSIMMDSREQEWRDFGRGHGVSSTGSTFKSLMLNDVSALFVLGGRTQIQTILLDLRNCDRFEMADHNDVPISGYSLLRLC